MSCARRRFGVLASVLASIVACGETERPIAVDVKTDYVPGRELAGVAIYAGWSDDGSREPTFMNWVFALPGEDFDRGVRLGLVERTSNPVFIAVELWDPESESSTDPFVEPFLYTALRVDDATLPAVTVVLSRSCEGVDCTLGPDRTPQACFAGACVDMRCTPETPEHCGAPQCGADSDCPSATPCAPARCEDGVCLAPPRDHLCASGEVCDPRSGCTPP